MRDREIDAILEQAAGTPHDVDPALLDRIANSVGRSFAAVRPVRPAWVLGTGLILICAAAAVAFAALVGFYGVRKLSGWERALVFPVLAILVWLAATTHLRWLGWLQLLAAAGLVWWLRASKPARLRP